MCCAAWDLQTGEEESRRPAHPNQTDLDPHHPGDPDRSVTTVTGCHGDQLSGRRQADCAYVETAGAVMEKLRPPET